jgi:hypothetical protein
MPAQPIALTVGTGAWKEKAAKSPDFSPRASRGGLKELSDFWLPAVVVLRGLQLPIFTSLALALKAEM